MSSEPDTAKVEGKLNLTAWAWPPVQQGLTKLLEAGPVGAERSRGWRQDVHRELTHVSALGGHWWRFARLRFGFVYMVAASPARSIDEREPRDEAANWEHQPVSSNVQWT